MPTAMPSVPSMSSQRQLAGQGDRLLVAAVVAGHELGDLVVEHLRARQFGQPALDVTRRGGGVAGENVAEIALALDEVALVGQHHQRVADGGVAVRMILHRMADHVGDLDEPPVVLFVQRPEDAPLHRLQAVGQIGDGAVADDVGGVVEKAAVHAAMQTAAGFPGVKRDVRDGGGHVLGEDMRRAVAVGGSGLLRRLSSPSGAGIAPSMGNSGWSDSFLRLADMISN